MKFNGVKVFSATQYNDRAVLGEKVTEWLAQHASYDVADIKVTQSSDSQFHCIAITVFYLDPKAAARTVPAKGAGLTDLDPKGAQVPPGSYKWDHPEKK